MQRRAHYPRSGAARQEKAPEGFCSMCGPRFCSIQITQEVPEYARAQGIAEDSEALECGMEAKSQEFLAEGAELYPGA